MLLLEIDDEHVVDDAGYVLGSAFGIGDASDKFCRVSIDMPKLKNISAAPPKRKASLTGASPYTNRRTCHSRAAFPTCEHTVSPALPYRLLSLFLSYRNVASCHVWQMASWRVRV